MFLKVKWLGKGFYIDVFKLKHLEDKCDNIRKRYGNGRSAPRPTPHCIKCLIFISEFTYWKENSYMNCKMVLNNTNKNNSILLEAFASVFTVSSYFTDNPRMSYKQTYHALYISVWSICMFEKRSNKNLKKKILFKETQNLG